MLPLPLLYAQGQRQHDAVLVDEPAALLRVIVRNAGIAPIFANLLASHAQRCNGLCPCCPEIPIGCNCALPRGCGTMLARFCLRETRQQGFVS
jgi:hypothetical protein